MNREQAGHLLDAYAEMENYGDHEASKALREVILDAMEVYPQKGASGITLSGTMPPNQITAPKPNWGYTHVTCRNGGVE